MVLWAGVKGQAVYLFIYWRKEAGRLFSALTGVISTPALDCWDGWKVESRPIDVQTVTGANLSVPTA